LAITPGKDTEPPSTIQKKCSHIKKKEKRKKERQRKKDKASNRISKRISETKTYQVRKTSMNHHLGIKHESQNNKTDEIFPLLIIQ
jgi:hypothetical protein